MGIFGEIAGYFEIRFVWAMKIIGKKRDYTCYSRKNNKGTIKGIDKQTSINSDRKLFLLCFMKTIP